MTHFDGVIVVDKKGNAVGAQTKPLGVKKNLDPSGEEKVVPFFDIVKKEKTRLYSPKNPEKLKELKEYKKELAKLHGSDTHTLLHNLKVLHNSRKVISSRSDKIPVRFTGDFYEGFKNNSGDQ